MKLSKTAIEAVPHPDKGQVFYWFDSPRGFGLRVTPTAKSFIFEGRAQGRKRRVTIGRVDAFADLRRAQNQAISLAGAFNEGIDPVVERARKATEAAQEAAKTLTLRDAMQRYADAPKYNGGHMPPCISPWSTTQRGRQNPPVPQSFEPSIQATAHTAGDAGMAGVL